jgi:predicted ATPase
MYLSRLQIQRFRSLYDVDLALKPLTIIIGPNASGKSNLFKALRFLHDAVAGDRLEWQAYDSQIDHLLWYGTDEYGNRPQTMTFACEFSTDKALLGRYQVALRCGDYLRVESEALDVALSKGQEPSKYFQRFSNSIEFGAPLRKLLYSAPSPRTLTLRDEGPDLELPQARAIYRHIAGWRCFEVTLTSARQEAFIPQYPEEVPPLAEDGSNLSAFLYALWRLRPDDFDAIAELLSDCIGLPEKLLVEHDAERGGRSARYFFLEAPFGEARPVPPQSASDGTIRLLAYLALLLGDRSVSLACLEEPDHGLHPRLMLYLADVFRQVVARTQDPASDANEDSFTPQILITTHNPEFMDCFDLDEEQDYLQVYIAERDELGRTRFTSAASETLAPWLERYRLGEAVRRHFM